VTDRSLKDSKEENEIEFISEGDTKRVLTLVTEPTSEIFKRKRLNLQFIALAMVLVIIIISPLRLIDSRTAVDITAVGFISASLIPSLIAIFGFLPGRKFCLLLSTLIYGAWILVLSAFFLEIILLFVVLIIYHEVTKTILIIQPLVEGTVSISEGGVYYHASVTISRYFKFLLRLSGILFSVSIVLSIIGYYLFEFLQSDILFSIFMIVSLIVLLIISRKTLTPDIEQILLQKRREKMEEEMAKSHSKYS